jgi:hypothetical protein
MMKSRSEVTMTGGGFSGRDKRMTMSMKMKCTYRRSRRWGKRGGNEKKKKNTGRLPREGLAKFVREPSNNNNTDRELSSLKTETT